MYFYLSLYFNADLRYMKQTTEQKNHVLSILAYGKKVSKHHMRLQIMASKTKNKRK